MEKEKNNQETVEAKSSPESRKKNKDRKWQKPVLEDVSGKVMAQPYIRFT